MSCWSQRKTSSIPRGAILRINLRLVHLLTPLRKSMFTSCDNRLNVKRNTEISCRKERVWIWVWCFLALLESFILLRTGVSVVFYEINKGSQHATPGLFSPQAQKISPGGRFSIRQPVSRSRSGSQTSAGIIYPSFSAELRADAATMIHLSLCWSVGRRKEGISFISLLNVF